MSNLSTLSSPGKFNQHNFVASGTLASGQAVALNTDGTVSVVDTHSKVDVLGTPVVFESGNTSQISTAFDSTNNKVIIAYRDPLNAGYGTAVVGTVSGSTITWGTPVVFESASTHMIESAITFDPVNNKIVIAYRDFGNSNYGTAIVGTVAGTSISFGTPVVFNSTSSFPVSSTYDSNNGKVVIAYRDAGNPQYGAAIVGTVAGTDISFGTHVVFNSAVTEFISATFDSSNNKVVIAYSDEGNSNFGTAVVGTVAGTSISFGTPVVFESAIAADISATFDSLNNKVVIAYTDSNNSSYGTAVVGTVAGTDISFGTPVVFNSAITNYTTPTFDSNSNKVVIAYQDQGNSRYGTAVVGTVSGTDISFDTPVVFNSAITYYTTPTFDSTNNKVVIAYQDVGNSNYGTAVVFDLQSVIGTPAVFESATTFDISATFDPVNNKVVIAYRDNGNSNYGTAIVGTVSGSSVSFGAPVVFNSGYTVEISTTFDSVNNKVVIAYTDGGNSGYGTAVVGAVGGTSISFGTNVVFNSENTSNISTAFDPVNNKVVIAYRDYGNSSYGTAIVGTVAVTDISFGTPVVFESITNISPGVTAITFDSFSNQVVIFYESHELGQRGKAIVGAVSGTTISFGTPEYFGVGTNFDDLSPVFDSFNNKVVVAYRSVIPGSVLGNTMSAVVGTVSGTSISFGTRTDLDEGADQTAITAVFDSFNNKVVIAYRRGAADAFRGTVTVGTVSGTGIIFDTEIALDGTAWKSDYSQAVFDPVNNKVVLAYRDQIDGKGEVVTLGAQDANSTDFIGITDQAIADTTRGSVTMKGGISSNVTGLTPNLIYYVQEDGSLSTTPSAVLAGKALAATKINLEYTS